MPPRAAGSPAAFLICVTAVVTWAASGPVFGFSEKWQLVINTGTTIVTFLMVFLIQNTQNRDGAALQAKLDELIRSSDAEDEFMGIEKLTDKELDELHAKCEEAARVSQAAFTRAHTEREARRRRRCRVPITTGRAEARKLRSRSMGTREYEYRRCVNSL